MPQYGITKLECRENFIQSTLVALNIHQYVMRFMQLYYGMGELTTTPVFQSMNLAAAHGHHGAVALDHGGYLLALVRMNQKHDFVVSHCCSLRVKAARTFGAARRIRGI